MKRIILLNLLFSFSAAIYAQWQTDFRLTNDPAISQTSMNYGWSIAASGDTVHIQFFDHRNGQSQIYYKRSTDKGISWSADLRLVNTIYYAERGSIAVNGPIVHVVWQDWRNPSWEIYYKRSTDGGTTWGPDTRLTNDPGNSWAPGVFVSGSLVNVLWSESRDGNMEVYYKRSSDGGLTWGSDIRLSNDPAESWYPVGAASGANLHIAWSDLRDGNFEVYYKRSTDGGISWGSDTRLTNSASYSQNPSISLVAQTIHLAWSDDRDGNYEIYYKKSTNNGTNWSADTRLTNSAGTSITASLSSYLSNVHMTWEDMRDGNYEIYYKFSSNYGANWGSDIRLTNSSAMSLYSSVCLSGPVVHVVWFDERDGNREIYYKRNPTGNITSIIKNGSELAYRFYLSQNYPNPFNPKTIISVQCAMYSNVKLIIYNASGKEVITLINDKLYPGEYKVLWDASDNPSGVYYYKLIAGDYSETRKMVLIK